MSGIDDLNFEDLVDGAINTIDDAKTERFEAKRLIQPKIRHGASIAKSGTVAAPRSSVNGDETLEMSDETARMNDPNGPPEIPEKATGGKASFDHIYMRSGVEAADFTVFRIEELFNDEDLVDLDEKGRVSAVRAILKSHDVDFEVIVDDAVARRAALDTHDQRLKSNIQRVEREMEKENAKLQSEIEEYANPRIERMEKNNDRVERLRRDYADWFARKTDEHDRIISILDPWGGDERLLAAENSEVVDVPRAAPYGAVSGDEAFEPQDRVAAPQAVDDSLLATAGADQWDFPEDATLDPIQKPKVATELPSEYAPAEPVAVTGEFEFQQSAMRVPRTAIQWLFTLLTLCFAIVVAVLLAAQLSMVEAGGAILLGFVSAPLLALVPTVFSRHRSDFWSGWVVWWFVFTIAGFAFAHLDPANLVTNLTKRPIWFVDEAGLNAEVEEAVHSVTRPYAEAIGPLLGAEAAIWNAPAKAAPDDTPKDAAGD